MWNCDWSSDVCSSDLLRVAENAARFLAQVRADVRAQDCVGEIGDAGVLEQRAGALEEVEIGRASCRKECRSGGWRYHATKSKRTTCAHVQSRGMSCLS